MVMVSKYSRLLQCTRHLQRLLRPQDLSGINGCSSHIGFSRRIGHQHLKNLVPDPFPKLPSRTLFAGWSQLSSGNNTPGVRTLKFSQATRKIVSEVDSGPGKRHFSLSSSTALKASTLPLKMDGIFPKKITDSSFLEAFLKEIDAVMFDCDGVLWLGVKIFSGAPELVKKLRSMGKKVFFMTNNSTKTREEFLAKFNTLGFETTLDEIVSTSFLAALHLKEQNFNKKVYVIGTAGITKELQAVNIKTLSIGADVVPNDMFSWAVDHLDKVSLDPEVGAVVVGFDHHFNYTKLFKAASYLKDPSCIFIATNTDESFPSSNNMVIPGTGSIVKAVETASQREPAVMGKPSRIPFDYVRRFHSLDSNRVLMIGDRSNTDILFGANCGLHTLLVLSGVTTLEEVQKWSISEKEIERQYVPEFYIKDVGALLKLVQQF